MVKDLGKVDLLFLVQFVIGCMERKELEETGERKDAPETAKVLPVRF